MGGGLVDMTHGCGFGTSSWLVEMVVVVVVVVAVVVAVGWVIMMMGQGH